MDNVSSIFNDKWLIGGGLDTLPYFIKQNQKNKLQKSYDTILINFHWIMSYPYHDECPAKLWV